MDRYHDKMTAEDWMDLARQIPFTEVNAHAVIHRKLVHAQSQDLIALLNSDKVPSLSGLLVK